MITRILDLPENVLGFSAEGKVTAEDYEKVIMPAVEGMFAKEGKGRFLYHLGDGYAGFEAGAMWDDAKVGFKHLRGWEKVAMVSDVEWIRGAVKMFRVIMPGQVRVFHNGELAEAKKWVGE